MIFTAIIVGMLALVQLLLSPLPSLPTTPQPIFDGGNTIINLITSVISFLAYIFSPTLLAAAVAIFIAIFAFDTIYNTVMWTIKKIPMLNIK